MDDFRAYEYLVCVLAYRKVIPRFRERTQVLPCDRIGLKVESVKETLLPTKFERSDNYNNA